MFKCARNAAVWGAADADAPLIELAVITGVVDGFPGICSCGERSLAACRGFHTYRTYSQIHRPTYTCHGSQNNPRCFCALQMRVDLKLCIIENEAHAQ